MMDRNDNHGWTLVLKLRSNIELEGDLQLAEREIAKLLGYPPEPLDKAALHAMAVNGIMQPADLEHCRAHGTAAYYAQTERLRLADLFRKLSFIELVAGSRPLSHEYWSEVIQELESVPAAFIRFEIGKDRVWFRLLPFNTAAEWSDIIAKHAVSPGEAVKALVRTLELAREGLLPDRRDVLPERAMSAKLTTGHLFHGLHVYKAKFFPRMVRALMNAYSPRADPLILDPYVGSGTALTEASVMGMPSVGVDIDPLSAFIASVKIKLIHESREEMPEKILAIRERLDALRTWQLPLFQAHGKRLDPTTLIPPFLIQRIPPETQTEIIEDISLILSAISSLNREAALPLLVALSDAISRKFRFRFLGLGHGRFSLNIRPERIIENFINNIGYLANSIAMWQWLRQAANLTHAPSRVLLGDARSLPFGEETFDLVVTSPPYLPAASGRESYLKSKALAMIALGLIRADMVEAYEQMLVGSVHRTESPDGLPPKARAVVEWMAADAVRRIKASAAASYFADLVRSLREIRRVLRPGGRCVLVVARQHTFYRYTTREVVHVIENVDVVSELAEWCGLEPESVIHIELNKRNAVARPRSSDAYYESVLILRRQ